ncbi:MAG: hypothetical protein ABIH22_00670, partial [Candidatus Margulisiibacteriota bacterium]
KEGRASHVRSLRIDDSMSNMFSVAKISLELSNGQRCTVEVQKNEMSDKYLVEAESILIRKVEGSGNITDGISQLAEAKKDDGISPTDNIVVFGMLRLARMLRQHMAKEEKIVELMSEIQTSEEAAVRRVWREHHVGWQVTVDNFRIIIENRLEAYGTAVSEWKERNDVHLRDVYPTKKATVKDLLIDPMVFEIEARFRDLKQAGDQEKISMIVSYLQSLETFETNAVLVEIARILALD